MIHFSELSQVQVEEMCGKCVDAAIEYADSKGVSGLSHEGVHNVYNALHYALVNEWMKSKRAMAEFKK